VDAALSALDATRDPDDLDRALESAGFTPVAVPDLDGSMSGIRRLPSAESFELVARAEALSAWSSEAGWKGLWWTRGRVDGDALMVTCVGLPTPDEFGWLVESRSPRVADPKVAGATSGPMEE
jgi:hypothetical protein